MAPHLRYPDWAMSVYITGGAIKLTATMQEREHTRMELVKMDRVRRFLLEENIIDDDGFVDYMSELE